MTYPPRKYAGLQHAVYLSGWKDCLHKVGEALENVRDRSVEFDFAPEATLALNLFEEELGKLVPR